MKKFKKIMLLLGLAMFLVSVTGCEQGPMEKAGEKIDNTIEKAGDELKK